MTKGPQTQGFYILILHKKAPQEAAQLDEPQYSCPVPHLPTSDVTGPQVGKVRALTRNLNVIHPQKSVSFSIFAQQQLRDLIKVDQVEFNNDVTYRAPKQS